jgi:sec-independent protein translocase protein TatB
MFGVGSMEMAVIALVALMVIGPERLPTVMGQVGRWYRQLRTMSNELLAEARQQWEEGMREIQTVTDDVNSAWNTATTAEPDPKLPPPPLRQVPPPLAQARTAAEAGPWVLPAWHNAPSPEVEPMGQAIEASVAPTMLPRTLPRAYDPAVDDLSGAPTLMGPAPTEEELAAMAYDLPAESPAPAPVATPAPMPVANGSPNGAGAYVAGEEESPESIRERTIVDLYLKGGITLEGATKFLGVDESEFLSWVEFARMIERAGA